MSLILLIDDNQDNRAIYCRLFQFRGHRCLEAENGAVGLVVARTRKPDVILLDINMPVMNGWETVGALKMISETRGIPVIALTANETQEAEDRVGAAGFDGFVRKLSPPMEVVVAVEKMLAGSSTRESGAEGAPA